MQTDRYLWHLTFLALAGLSLSKLQALLEAPPSSYAPRVRA